MAEITENPRQFQPIRPPEAEVILCGRGRVNFPWKFTRRVPFWFLYCNTEPGACLEFSDRTLRPDADEIILIPPFTRFRSSCEHPFDHLYIHFAAGRPFSQVTPGPIVLKRSVAATPLQQIFHAETPPAAAVYALLFTALCAIPEERFAAPETPVDDRIQRALSMMSRGMDNAALCAAVGMSISNFQRKFKQTTGISPRRCAMQLRLEKARCSLISGETDICRIARECGFADRYAFSKAFKKYTGIPPARYRLREAESEEEL